MTPEIEKQYRFYLENLLPTSPDRYLASKGIPIKIENVVTLLAGTTTEWKASRHVATTLTSPNWPGREYVALTNVRGEFRGLQYFEKIEGKWEKRYEKGTSKQGSFVVCESWTPDDNSPFDYECYGERYKANRVIIAEGFGTACAIRATLAAIPGDSIDDGTVVVAALDCGNLLPVASAIREAYTGIEIVVAADDDRDHGAANPGTKKAREACRAAQARLMVIPADFGRADQGVDFADLYQAEGGAARILERLEQAAFVPPEKDATPRLNLISAAVLLATPPKPREFLIDGLLPFGIPAGLTGAGGVRKSTLALQMAVAEALGSSFAGLGDAEEGQVTFITTEDDIEEVQRRLWRILDGMEQAAWSRGEPGDVLRREWTEKLGCNLRFHADEFKLFEDQRRSPMIDDLIREAGESRLIVLDPLAQLHDFDEENSNAVMTRIVSASKEIVRATCATVLVLHHISKEAAKNGTRSQTASRGGSGFVDGMRWIGQLVPMSSEEAKKISIKDRREFVEFSVQKSNYTALFPETWLRSAEGFMWRHEFPKDAKEQADLEKLRAEVQTFEDSSAYYTKTELAGKLSGKDGAFGIGRNKVVELIETALRRGHLRTVPAESLPFCKHRKGTQVVAV